MADATHPSQRDFSDGDLLERLLNLRRKMIEATGRTGYSTWADDLPQIIDDLDAGIARLRERRKS